MSSLQLVFVPQIQRDMDCYVQAWNNHRVRSINENGRSILGQVPEAAFQMHERLFNGLGPPLVNKAQNARFLASSSNPVETITLVTHQDDTLPVLVEAAEVVGLQAHEEFSTVHTTGCGIASSTGQSVLLELWSI